MADTRLILTPEAAHFPATGFAFLDKWGTGAYQQSVIEFVDGADTYCYWTFVAWQGLSGALTAIISYRADTVTTGTAGFEVSLECVSDGEDTDGNGFDTANAGSGTVPGTAGNLDQISIALTNDDSIAAGDLVRLKLLRDESIGVVDELGVLAVEIREA